MGHEEARIPNRRWLDYERQVSIVRKPADKARITTSSAPHRGAFSFVDMVGKRLNRIQDYLSRFWEFYQTTPNLQKALENNKLGASS